MTILFASNNPIVFVNPTASNTASTNFDSVYVKESSYLFNGGSSTPITFPASDTDTVWFHWTQRSYTTNSVADDGHAGPQIQDIAGLRIFYHEVTDGNYAPYFNGNVAANGSFVGRGSGRVTYDVRVTLSGGFFTFEYWVNGVLVFAPAPVAQGTRTLPRKFYFFSTDVPQVYLTELIVSSTSTVGRRLIQLKPDAAGAYNGWSGDLANITTALVTTFRSTNAPDVKMSYTFDPYTGPQTQVIEGVVTEQVSEATGPAPLTKSANFLRIGGVDYESAQFDTTTPYSVLQDVRETNPATGLAWDWADLTGLEFGLKSYA